MYCNRFYRKIHTIYQYSRYFKRLRMQQDKVKAPIIYKHQNQWKQANCGECIHQYIGNKVDIQWKIKQGTMKLSPSKLNQQTHYIKNMQQGTQVILGANFRHGVQCPLLNPKIQLKPDKFMKPCTCVVLFNQNEGKFLVTQRASTLRTYPNAWVFPGGHLQKNQGIFEGGIRQCQQQVGLPAAMNIQPLKQRDILVWESVFASEGQIKACAIVVFFMANCQQFEPKIDINEVATFKWKKIEDKTDQKVYDSAIKEGYAEGHLKFLQIMRQAHNI